MKSSTKILSLLAASMLAASLPVVLAQGAPPPPPPPPPPAPAAMPPGGGAGSGMGRGQGGPGAAFGDAPTPEEYAILNKALKDLLSKDEAAAKVLAAHPNWAGPLVGFGGRGGAGAGSGRGRGGQGGGGGG